MPSGSRCRTATGGGRRTALSFKPGRRRGPDCKTPIRGRWREHAGMSGDFDPEGDVTWHCHRSTCLTGKDGF